MLREHCNQQRLLRFIVRFHAQHGKMPTNLDISAGETIPTWRVASMLTELVRTGHLTRVQLRERGSKRAPKYAYSLPGTQEGHQS